MKVGRIEPGNEAKCMIGEDIIEGLCTFIKGDWIDDNVDGAVITRKWFGAAEDSINDLFSFASEPDFHAGEMIKIMSTLTFSEDETPPLRLARVLFLLGHVAIKLLYMEQLTKELKKANSTKTVVKQEVADKKNKEKKEGEDSNDDAIQAELGVVQEQEAVTEQTMAEIAEKEVSSAVIRALNTIPLLHYSTNTNSAIRPLQIAGRGLLGVFGPIRAVIAAFGLPEMTPAKKIDTDSSDAFHTDEISYVEDAGNSELIECVGDDPLVVLNDGTGAVTMSSGLSESISEKKIEAGGSEHSNARLQDLGNTAELKNKIRHKIVVQMKKVRTSFKQQLCTSRLVFVGLILLSLLSLMHSDAPASSHMLDLRKSGVDTREDGGKTASPVNVSTGLFWGRWGFNF